jgi:hypothetical protein
MTPRASSRGFRRQRRRRNPSASATTSGTCWNGPTRSAGSPTGPSTSPSGRSPRSGGSRAAPATCPGPTNSPPPALPSAQGPSCWTARPVRQHSRGHARGSIWAESAWATPPTVCSRCSQPVASLRRWSTHRATWPYRPHPREPTVGGSSWPRCRATCRTRWSCSTTPRSRRPATPGSSSRSTADDSATLSTQRPDSGSPDRRLSPSSPPTARRPTRSPRRPACWATIGGRP